MKKSKWMRPICSDMFLGMNDVLIKAIQNSPYAFLVRNIKSAWVDCEVVIHSYQEVGTGVAVVFETRENIKGISSSPIIKFHNIVI